MWYIQFWEIYQNYKNLQKYLHVQTGMVSKAYNY